MRAANKSNLSKEVGVIVANKELNRYRKGTLKRITDLKTGVLLIEFNNKEQAYSKFTRDFIRRIGLNWPEDVVKTKLKWKQ